MSREQIRDRVKSEAKDFVTDGLLGKREWDQSKVWYLTGFSSIAAGASKGLSGAGRSGKYTFGLIKHAFSREKSEPLACDSSDPRVRFGAAMERYQLSENQVSEIQRRSTQMSVVWMLIVTALTVWGFYYASNEGGAAGLAGFVCHLFAVPMMLRQLFWNYQLRHRSLNSFRDFVRSGDWLPFSRATAGIMIAIAAGAAMFLVPGAANAADGFSGLDFLTESASQPGTLYYELLQVLAPVGPVEPGAMQSPWAGPLSNAMRVFNVTLLSVGGAMLGWHTMSGMVSTAHEGKMLGQKWHQIWAPIRVTAGVGFLAPIAGGFSAVQILVLHVALWGSAFADLVWNAYTDTFRDQTYMTNLLNTGTDEEYTDKFGNPLPRKDLSASVKAFADSENGRQLIFGLIERQVCMRGLQYGLERAAASLENRGQSVPDDLATASGSDAEAILTRFKQMSPDLAAGISADANTQGSANTITFFDIFSQQPQHRVGIGNENGTLFSGFTYPAASDGTKLLIEEGGTAAVTWNFGVCGSVKINPFSIEKLQETLALDPSSYQSLELVADWNPLQYSEPNWDAVSADLLQHQVAYNLVMNSAEQIGSQVDATVLPHTQLIADMIFNSVVYMPDAVNGMTPQDIETILVDADGPLVETLAAAYQAWLDIINTQRASVGDNVYDLIDTTDMNPYIDMAQEKGWAAAGAFYMVLAKTQQNNYNIDQIEASFGGGFTNWNTNGMVMRDDLLDVFGRNAQGEGLIARFAQVRSLNYDAITENEEVIAQEFASKNIESNAENTIFFDEDGFGGWVEQNTIGLLKEGLTKLQNMLASGLLDLVLMLEPDPYFALVEMVNFGLALVNIAMLLWLMSLLGFLLGGPLTGGPIGTVVDKLSGGVLENIVTGVVGVLKLVGTLIFVLGIVHAFILPMIPYVFFTFFTLGMVVLIAEAMVAAPIWALMHVRMDGAEFVDNMQRPGYMIVFNLFLRPALAILGLIFSFSVFSAGMWLVNATFEIAARASMSDGLSLVGVLVMVCIMTYMHYQIATRAFGLITEVPDRVTRWFGQGGENLGEAEEAKRTTALFVNSAESRMREVGGMASAGKKPNGKEPDGKNKTEGDGAANKTDTSSLAKD